jgi:hypothetical protein
MTRTLSNGVERRCRPLAQWPQWDLCQWQSALQAGDLLEQGGSRAERSRFSNRAMEQGYGCWLNWLDSGGLLDTQVAPGDRITPDRVRAYVGHLEAENASGTVVARIIELKVTAAIMAPERDWSWIYRLASAIRTRHKAARPKRHRMSRCGPRSGSPGHSRVPAEASRPSRRRGIRRKSGLCVKAHGSIWLHRAAAFPILLCRDRQVLGLLK